MTIAMKADKLVTTFEAAKICGVFHTTVINWVNQGKLPAYRTPGGHRRIELGVLVEFMKKYAMRIPENLLQHRKQILIVEDEPAVQRMLARTLQPLDKEADVQTCAGGMEALIQIGREAPDLVILDIRIPEINGLELCQLLRANEHTREAKIIAVSGKAISSEEEKFLKAHADHFFAKPLSTATFRQKVMELLDMEAPVGDAIRAR